MASDGRSRRHAPPARKAIKTPLGEGTLNDRDLLAGTSYGQPIRILPALNVIKFGGQSLMDRGRSAVFPIIEEIAQAAKRHQILIGAGGGTRARHAYSLALELGLPTGVLAAIGWPTSLQNAHMLQMLLAKHGGVLLNLMEDFDKLPLFLRTGCIPICVGMPPYQHWEPPAASGHIPANRTDSGVYLTAEFLGARSCIFLKDEDGLFTEDPKKHPDANVIPRIRVKELMAMDLNDLVVDRVVLENMLNATHVREIQIINALVSGNLTKALDGQHVGTIIEV
jgi:molybdenum storage protein